MKNDVSQRERSRQGEAERDRGRSQQHVYLLWIHIGGEGFPSGDVPEVKRAGGNRKTDIF